MRRGKRSHLNWPWLHRALGVVGCKGGKQKARFQTPRRDLRLWNLKQLSLGGKMFPTLPPKPKKKSINPCPPLCEVVPSLSKTGCQRHLTLKSFHLPVSQVLSIIQGPGFLRGKIVMCPCSAKLKDWFAWQLQSFLKWTAPSLLLHPRSFFSILFCFRTRSHIVVLSGLGLTM